MKLRRVSVIIFYDAKKRILVQDRTGISKRGEKWAFFGGHIEEGETPEQAVVRETKEELDFDLKEYRFIGMYDLSGDGHKVHAYVFISPLKDNLKKFAQKEGIGMKLVSADEAKKIGMIPGDEMVVDEVMRII